MKTKRLNPRITLVSLKTVDAGLFILVNGVIRNNTASRMPMVRYQLEVRNEDREMLGYQIGNIPNLKPHETRAFEVSMCYEGAKFVKILSFAEFQE